MVKVLQTVWTSTVLDRKDARSSYITLGLYSDIYSICNTWMTSRSSEVPASQEQILFYVLDIVEDIR